jgi:hypothetical protein
MKECTESTTTGRLTSSGALSGAVSATPYLKTMIVLDVKQWKKGNYLSLSQRLGEHGICWNNS